MFAGRGLRGVRGWILAAVVIITLCCVGGIVLWGFATFGYADTLRGEPPGMLPPVPSTAQPPSSMIALPGGGSVSLDLPSPSDVISANPLSVL